MTNSKITRRKTLLLIAGVSASFGNFWFRAQKKKPSRNQNSAWIGGVVAAVCGGLGVLWVVFKKKDFRE